MTSRPVERREWLRGVAFPVAVIAATIAVSVFAMTVPFLGKQWLLGDLAYHRGVTLSIDITHPFGEGPIAGVTSYYGGLYHLLLAGISAVGLTFAGAVGVLSLIWAVVWPISLLALGRRLWPGDLAAAALFAAVGTLAMPLTTNFAADLWVESVVPSGMAFWPAYPRDLALSFGILATAFFLDPRTVRRRVGAGVFLGLAIATHPQIAATSAAVIVAWAAFRAVRGEGKMPILDAIVALALAIVLSAWWWLPRLGLVLSGPALLADAPDRLPFRMSPQEFVLQLSWLGIAAVASLGLLVLRRRIPGGHPILTIWLAVILPLLVFDRLAGGSAIAPERRTWLQLSIPIAAIAAYELLAVLRRLDRPAAGAILAGGLAVLSIPAMLATLTGLGQVWEDRRIAGRPWPAAEWEPALAELRSLARAGPHEILTYDTEAPWVWSFTGARVFSLWLPGPIKLGFDPAIYTGIGYPERVRLAAAAFDRGMDGVCGLATERGIRTLLLRSLDDLVATHDHPFAAPFRTNPADRSDTPPMRELEPGIAYLDTGPDWLLVDRNVELPIPFASADIQTVVVEVRAVTAGERIRLTLTSGETEESHTTDRGSGVQAIRFDLAGRNPGDELTIRANNEVLFLRALGYEAVEFAHPPDGVFVSTTAAACA